MNLSDVNESFKLSMVRAETQIKMRNQYVDEVMKHVIVDADMEEHFRKLISDAYSKGAIDCLTIIMVSDQAMQEGGDQDV